MKDISETADLTPTLTQAGAHLAGGRVRHFGAPVAEVRALERAGVVPLLGVAPLRLTGGDRLEFLHGQVSNEVKRLRVGETNAALMLNVKGHALALMRAFRREDDLFVAVEGGAGAAVRTQFQAHIIFDQVAIEDLTDALSTLTVQGEEAEAVLESGLKTGLPAEGQFSQIPFQNAKVLVSKAARSLPGGFDLHVLTRDAPALFEVLRRAGAAPAGEDALCAARVTAGLPSAEGEGGEGVLPQEAGLEFAVSYRKGCYLGQEIMARVEARGNVRRRLVGLRLDARPEADARDVFLDGKKVGRLGTLAEHPDFGVIALGSVRSEVEPGTRVEVGGVAAILSTLPF